MSNQNENLGGRLPLLYPKELAPAQAELYKVMNNTLIAWSKQSGFVVKTRDGKFIGPFNPSLYSPAITDGFSKFMDAEPKNTKLDKRTRQIVILTVGAVWDSPTRSMLIPRKREKWVCRKGRFRHSRQVNRQRVSLRMNLSLTASLDSLLPSAG
jgi:hypothetical protein